MAIPLEADVARKMRALIERGWTRGSSAVDAGGMPCSVHAREACAWCLHGAYRASTDGYLLGERSGVRRVWAYIEQLCGCGAINWNDVVCRDQKQALDLMDRVIQHFEDEYELSRLTAG
jgi:hypothetical protein